MPVLILAVLSVVLFICTLVLLGFAEAAEARKMRRLDLVSDNGSPFRVLSVCDAFEAEYAILWETQISALSLIAAAPRGVPRQQLFAVYRRVSCQYPELYEGSCFQQWLQFLESEELVVVRDNRIQITPQGREFLKFRVETKVAA